MSVVDDVRDVPYQPVPASTAPVETPPMVFLTWHDRLRAWVGGAR